MVFTITTPSISREASKPSNVEYVESLVAFSAPTGSHSELTPRLVHPGYFTSGLPNESVRFAATVASARSWSYIRTSGCRPSFARSSRLDSSYPSRTFVVSIELLAQSASPSIA